MSLGKLWELARTGRPGVLQFMGSQRVGHDMFRILFKENYSVKSSVWIEVKRDWRAE